jgi:hypothetical protein
LDVIDSLASNAKVPSAPRYGRNPEYENPFFKPGSLGATALFNHRSPVC